MPHRLSIIIPTLNEAETLPVLLEYLQTTVDPQVLEEILVVDGGSSDGTFAVGARYHGVKMLSAPRGRATQMNWGGVAAQGTILYFLHADTLPPKGFAYQVIESVEQGEAGCFRLRFDNPFHILLKIAPWFTQFPSSFFRGGDQSLFITKSAFVALGGYNERYRVYEDIEIIHRIRKQMPFRILPGYVLTASRRFQVNGTWRLYFHFLLIHLKYKLGMSPEALLEHYRKHIRS